MKRVLISSIVAAVVASVFAPRSSAIPPFYKEFTVMYLDDNDNEDFVKEAKAAKCFLCHVGKKKTNRNEYGEQLSELLDKKKDKKDTEKIRKALETVGGMNSIPDDKESPTFAVLIQEGKLPGGEVQKKDPKDDVGEDDDSGDE